MVTEAWGGEACLGGAGGAQVARPLPLPFGAVPHLAHLVPAQAGGEPWPFLCLIFVPSPYHP